LVLDAAKATKIIELCEGALVFENKWHPGKDGGASVYTKHVYMADEYDMTMQFVTDDFVEMCKLAGKPE
jgi:hypothetical protein